MNKVVSIVSDKSDLAMRRKESIKRLVQDEPYFKGAIDEVRQDIANEWANTALIDTVTREALYMQLGALDDIVGRLTAYANDVTFRMKKKDEEDDAS